MAKRIFSGQPAFVGQALLILLPLLVLAVVSALSLRQDRILAEHEAAERAQAIADEILPKIWNEIFQDDRFHTNYIAGSETLSFAAGPQGQLISPPPLQPV